MRILLIEDQRKMARFIRKGLLEKGYSVDHAETSASAETLACENEYDLIILDVMLPDAMGFDTARRIREMEFQGPILMLTALSGTKDKIHGLDAGADDYLTKPFEFEELAARVRALLRRKETRGSHTILRFEDLEMNLVERTVKRNHQSLVLTQKEFALLEFFLRNPNRPLSRTSIAEHVWDMNFDSDSNVIDVYINQLRKKVDSPFSQKLLHTLIGVGYLLKKGE